MRCTQLYKFFLWGRPALLGHIIKICCRVKRVIISTKAGFKFWVDPASVFGYQLLDEGIYEPQMTKLIEMVLRPADTFVDVGGG